MDDVIAKVKGEGYTPVVYIESDLARKCDKTMLLDILDKAKDMNIPVHYSDTLNTLCRRSKLYVLRYGALGDYDVGKIVKRGGKVVSGHL